MLDFIPVSEYTHYFHLAVLCLVLIVFWQCSTGSILNKGAASLNAGWGFVLAVILILYIGLRPISYEFGDTINYASTFERYKQIPMNWEWGGDWLYYNLMHWFARNSDIHMFFLLCSFLYVFPLWLAMNRIFKQYSFIPFLIFLAMFTFWAYGVNGVRNGIAASLIILAMTYVEELPILTFLCIIATGFHNSVLLIIGAGVLTWLITNSYYYLTAWFVCIIISYIAGFTIQEYLASLPIGIEDERFGGYLTATEEQMRNEGFVVSMTFRWDFIAYSALGVGVGYYFIFVRKFQDEYYHWIYNTYLALNAFWILIIRAAYSNRFAQISWFILPIVLIYPFMKKRFWVNHEKMLGYAILAFYAFAFYSNILKG